MTLLPPAAYLTGTLEMFTEIGELGRRLGDQPRAQPDRVGRHRLAGLSVVLLGASAALRKRGSGGARRRAGRA